MVQSRKSEENIKIFHSILDVFGEERCKVKTFWNEIKDNYIDIVNCPDCPQENVISFATIALSDFSIGKNVNDIPLGVEFVAACDQKFIEFPNILSTCAFNIIIERSSCFPGAIYPEVISMYISNLPMKHILFVPPFGWGKEFRTLNFPNKTVTWLLAVPISDPEYKFARSKGSEVLQALFDEKQIDIYDLERRSTI
jgi:hypothetical protein